MSLFDILAWATLIIVAISAVIIVLYLASLPGRIAQRRKHPWDQAVRIAGWLSFFAGFALWPVVLVWAYVDAPAPSARPSR